MFHSLQSKLSGRVLLDVAWTRALPELSTEGWLVSCTTFRGPEVRISISASCTDWDEGPLELAEAAVLRYVNIPAQAPGLPITRARSRRET